MDGDRTSGPTEVGRNSPPELERWLQEFPPCASLPAERRFCRSEIAFEHDCGAVVQRMGNRSRRVYPFQSIVREWQRRKEWRACAQRIHRRSKIMQESWQGQFEGPRSSARSRFCFKYFYLQPGLTNYDGPC